MGTDQIIGFFSQINVILVTDKIGECFAYKMDRDM